MQWHTVPITMRLASVMQSILISAPKLSSCSPCVCRAYGGSASLLAGRPLGFVRQRGLPSAGLGCTPSSMGHRSLGACVACCSVAWQLHLGCAVAYLDVLPQHLCFGGAAVPLYGDLYWSCGSRVSILGA